MAGGSGTRFWPLSRKARPKQLLPLAGATSLLHRTVERIAPLVPPERVLVVTSEALLEASRAELPMLPPENFLSEPVGRNTAPCIAWAAATIQRRDPNGLLAVLAADQHVTDEAGYRAVCARAFEAASAGALVTVGIAPTRPETGYGWLEMGNEIEPGVLEVARFVEKPDAARAEAYLAGGKHLWNGGQFFFRADAILAAVRTHMPELAQGIDAIDAAAARGEEDAEVRAHYGTLPSISIDHGVMERAEQVRCVVGDFGWSDVGSWTSAWELAEHDAQHNAVDEADAVLIDARGNYVRAPSGKVVALVGLEDFIVVDTPDALLVMPRSRAQDVRAVVAELQQRALGRT
jgi:mannose-1-phosphate guanylyltransferase